ncbi:MAG: Lrp/AsnC family transcriptional regulator, partial [Sediminibacterium sp.]|nr:Lrp/AsnC family transcriptional regulator [Sediminibacterium sp.]
IKDLSKKIHLSSTPIFERINKLEKLGIIKNYAAMLDYAKLNMQLMVICFVSLQQHDKKAGEKFIKQIQEIVEVVECLSISGNYDFMLKIIVENMDKYYQFHVNKLGKMDNIGQVQSSFVMGVVKQTGLILQ